MDNFNGDQPLDQKVITKLVADADRFELVVRDGHKVAAVFARGMVLILRRFSPGALSKFCAAEAGPSVRLPFLGSPFGPPSPPDAAYLGIVQPAIRDFKEALVSGDVARAVKALGATGILTKDDDPQKELRDLEVKLARTGGTWRLEFLPQLAKLAFWTGDTGKAEEYATEAVRLEPPGDPSSDGEATHDGNMVLGLIALQRGDTEKAKACLRESSRTNGGGYISTTGPNLSLAGELLKKNEREVVIQYFQECRRFWAQGRKTLDSWIEKIRSGDDPQFDPLHFGV
jgi:hypothetical protein